MAEEQLAIRGGPRTVRSRLPLQMAQVGRGLRRSLDLLGILPWTLRGKTSIADGSGPIAAFEREFCRFTGARHALVMNSGTAALHSAYFAAGVGPGTEVIVPSYTWSASATPILQCGAVPVFCDIDPQTLTADPRDIERRITERTRAICVVHIWGNPAPMDRIVEIARAHDLVVVEDCSHAHGARYRDRAVGTWGHVGCFSLQASKSVDGGELGVAVTDDPVVYDHMLLLGHPYLIRHKQEAKTFDVGDMSLGVKYRPHLFGVCLARSSLGRLPRRNQRASRAWRILCAELAGVPGIRPQEEAPDAERGGYYAFVFRYEGAELGGPSTEDFVAAVRAEGAPLDLDQFHDVLLHRSPLFSTLDRRRLGGGCWDPTRPWEEQVAREALPASEEAAARCVRLPPVLYATSESYVRDCARAIKKVLRASLPAASSPAAPGHAEAG